MTKDLFGPDEPEPTEEEPLPWIERRVPQMKRWVQEVDHTCFGHDDWAVASWYFVAAIAFRDAFIPRGAARINPLLHMLIIAPPASAKSTLGDMVRFALKSCSWPDATGEGEPFDVSVNVPLDMTTAGALGSLDAQKQKQQTVYVETLGAMEKYDAVMWDEAGSARSETTWNVNLLRGLNQVMDGRVLDRDLKGGVKQSQPKAALWMTAPDDFGFDDGILRTGFPQRMLTFWDQPTPEQDASVADRAASALSEGAPPVEGMEGCVKDFQRLFDYSRLVGHVKLDWRGVGGGFRGLSVRLTEMAQARVLTSSSKMDSSARWMRSFVHRYRDTAIKLAALNALARCAFTEEMKPVVRVSATDFQVAAGLVKVSAAQVFEYTVSKAWKYAIPRHVTVPVPRR